MKKCHLPFIEHFLLDNDTFHVPLLFDRTGGSRGGEGGGGGGGLENHKWL